MELDILGGLHASKGPVSGTKTLDAPSSSSGRILYLKSYFFSTLNPEDIVQNGDVAKLAGFQVYGASGLQVSDAKEMEWWGWR